MKAGMKGMNLKILLYDSSELVSTTKCAKKELSAIWLSF